MYDSVAHAVTLVISDNEENILYSSTQPLIKKEIQPNGDYGFMKFTVKQLNREDTDEEQKIMKREETKALERKLMIELYHQENGGEEN